jgi:hypothetical protein
VSAKRKICTALSLFTLGMTLPAFAELNQDNYTSENLLAKSALHEEGEGSPFSIDLSFEGTGKSKFEHDRCKIPLNDVEFDIAELDASMVFHYNECYKEGLLATVAYTYTRIKWDNPYFSQNHFDTVSLAIGGFTERAENWLWKGEVRLNADVDYFDISDNLFWNIVLAGRYAYTENIGLNIGFIAFTGMKIDRFYPIIGFDWKINESWRLDLVYPTNIALTYSLSEQWSFDVAGRAFDERHRVGKSKLHEWNKGLIEYRAGGIEIGVNYKTCNGNWLANVHVGEILGGRVRVATKGHHNLKRYTFKNAPYVGGEIAGRF